MRRIDEIIVHTSATPEGRHVTVEDIDRWHKKRGWSGIGYHWVIYLDGSVHAGRPESRVGAHVAGRNANTIGICYIGGVEANDVSKAKDTRTPAQKQALLDLLKALLARYPSIRTISGHHDYASKACPSFPARKEYAHLLERKPPDVPKPQWRVFREGSRGEGVRAMQEVLGVIRDGIFGPQTYAALRAYQRKHGLTIDGIAGPQTLSHMGLT